MLAKAALDLTQRADDLGEVLDVVFAGFPERLHDTAYALAVELVAVDLDLRQEELRWLEMLSDYLALDKLVVAAIERAARARLKNGLIPLQPRICHAARDRARVRVCAKHRIIRI